MAAWRAIVRSLRRDFVARTWTAPVREELPVDPQTRTLEVERLPGQTEQLTASHSACRGEPPECEQAVICDVIEESSQSAGGPCLSTSVDQCGRAFAARRVADQLSPTDSIVERTVDDGMHQPARGDREAVLLELAI